jgi:four helix bundle protein
MGRAKGAKVSSWLMAHGDMKEQMTKVKFSFEDLEVWQKAIDFTDKVISLVEKIRADRKHFRLLEQIEASSASIAMNIAEGKGRYSKKEFVQFLYIARGSLYESITLLIIFHKRKWINDIDLEDTITFGNQIGKMLSSLIKSIKSKGN